MTFEEARKKSRNPQAFNSADKWFVKNTQTGEPLESQFNEVAARRAAQYCNEHEVRCGREAVYDVEEFTA